MEDIDSLPGFRRRFRITPAVGHVSCALEDDFHCMTVVVHHDGEIATAVEPLMHRAPWTTCPGAVEQLRSTFTGVSLAGFAERGEKTANCTHLFDLALLAAAHAFDTETLVYDILVSDPRDGQRRVELRRNGVPELAWTEASFRIVEPAELAGMTLDRLRPWIDTLDPQRREAARLLRWGNMLANGRVIPLERQSDATHMPPNCYSFQPQRAAVARRVGVIRDFSHGQAEPLDTQVIS